MDRVRVIASVEFASLPGVVERRLVLVDIEHKAILIDQSSHAAVQEPPFRISIPRSTFHVEDLGLFCSSADSGKVVTIYFDSRAEIQAFAAKVRAINSTETKHGVVDGQLGHVASRIDSSPSTVVLQPRATTELASPSSAQTQRLLFRSDAHALPPSFFAPSSHRRPASHIQPPLDLDTSRSPTSRSGVTQSGSGSVSSEQDGKDGVGVSNVQPTTPQASSGQRSAPLSSNLPSALSQRSDSLPSAAHTSSVEPTPPPSILPSAVAGVPPGEDLSAPEDARSLPPVPLLAHPSDADASSPHHSITEHSTARAPVADHTGLQPAGVSSLDTQAAPPFPLPPPAPLSSIPETKRERRERGWDGSMEGEDGNARHSLHGISLDADHDASAPRRPALLDSLLRPPSLIDAIQRARSLPSVQQVTGMDTRAAAAAAASSSSKPPALALPGQQPPHKFPSLHLSPISVSRRTLVAPVPIPANGSGDTPSFSPIARAPSMWALPERDADAELLRSFLEDRCSVGSDPNGSDAATLLLRRKTAGEACSSLLLPTLSEKTKLVKVVEEFQDHSVVLVCRTRSHAEDAVISRDVFLRRLLMTGLQDVTYAEWERASLPAVGVAKPTSLRQVSRSEKLAEVLGGMMADGAMEVAVAGKDGKVIGVLSRDNIFAMVATEYVVDSAIKERMEKGSVSVMCDLRYEEDAEEQEQTLGMPRLRRAAADLLESASAKTALSIALLGDILVEVYDSFTHFPCVDCKGKWQTSEAYTDHGESNVPFQSYEDCRDRVWLSDCDKIASMTNPINMWATVSLITFFLETVLRIYAYRNGIYERYIESFDTLLVWLMCVTFLALFVGNEGDPKRNTDLRWVIAVARCLRFVRFIRVADKLRNVVGKEKSRYRKDGFDLDLSYITENCVAMSLPATGLEAKFRNPLDEVVRFFRQKHQTGSVPHYLIYNLCQERQYSPLLFDGNVEQYPTEDHNPCLLEHVCDFVESAERFTALDPRNTIAVHCKGGKGRTGMMVVCWLLYSGFSSARMKDAQQDALEWFALRRTGSEAKHKQGVGQPSQRRYITYFNKAMSSGGFRTPFLKLVKIIMHTCPSHECDPWFMVEQNYREVFDSAKHFGIQKMTRRQPSMEFACNTLVNGDIRITFYDHKEFPSRDEKIFFLWFHTGFIEDNHLSLNKNDIDGASRDKHNKMFRHDFRVELFFEPVTHSRVPYRKLERVSRPVLERTRQMSVRMRHQIVRDEASAGALARTADSGFVSSRPAAINHLLGQARYQDAGFDLDLTYVTDSIVVIAHPGTGSDAETLQYRAELKRFFLLKHGGAFRLYNLCPEPSKQLDDLFPGSTRHFPCLYRHPPPLQSIAELTQDCMQFLNEDTQNVAVFCCDSGKARSGVMVCACLIAKDVFSSSRQAIEYFNRMRGGGEFTFENPSQVRYIHNCETVIHLAKEGMETPMGERSVPIILEEVRLWTTEEDHVLKAADEVVIQVRGPETWHEPAFCESDRVLRTKSSASHGGEEPRPSSISSILSKSSISSLISKSDGSDVAEGDDENGIDVSREFLDFEPSHQAQRTPVAGDVRLSIMYTTKGKTRKHLSVCFHTSMAGGSYSSDIDIVDFSNSQVEHHDEHAGSSVTESGAERGRSVPRSFAMRLQVAFTRPQRHPLAGLEEQINRKRSMRKTASGMSTARGESASKVLDLSSSMGQRHQANLYLKDSMPVI